MLSCQVCCIGPSGVVVVSCQVWQYYHPVWCTCVVLLCVFASLCQACLSCPVSCVYVVSSVLVCPTDHLRYLSSHGTFWSTHVEVRACQRLLLWSDVWSDDVCRVSWYITTHVLLEHIQVSTDNFVLCHSSLLVVNSYYFTLFSRTICGISVYCWSLFSHCTCFQVIQRQEWEDAGLLGGHASTDHPTGVLCSGHSLGLPVRVRHYQQGPQDVPFHDWHLVCQC